jgi:hypothetical protein
MDPNQTGSYYAGGGVDDSSQWQSYIDDQGIPYFAHMMTGEVYYPENEYDVPYGTGEEGQFPNDESWNDGSYQNEPMDDYGEQPLEEIEGWIERSRVIGPMLTGHHNIMLTSIDFDMNHELLWVGRSDGLLQSYELTVQNFLVPTDNRT